MDFQRIFSVILAAAVPLALASGRTGGPAAPKIYRAYVGNYTSKTESKGIYSFRFDSETGKMSALALAGESKDPSWVVVHPNGRSLYAANEAGKGSTVSAFSIEAGSGKLALLNQQPAAGDDPCHLSFDSAGRFLLSANYSTGNVVVYPILPDGRLGGPTAVAKDEGPTGPDRKRQDGPHAHWIAAGEGNRSVYVADLGLDRVMIYPFDPQKGTLGKAGSAAAKPGVGPRHAAFSADGRFLYLLGELDSTVTVFSAEGGALRAVQTAPMLPSGFSGRNDAAEIEIHPSGKFLYASNRGRDSIVGYAIDAKLGTLTQIEDVPTGGKEPRHFAIDPSGKFLLVENQNSNSIAEFKIDPATGRLAPTGETLSVPSPVCIAFVPLE
jgi:6-phosphogluconolactonase